MWSNCGKRLKRFPSACPHVPQRSGGHSRFIHTESDPSNLVKRLADLLFEIINRHYEQKSTMITTNRPFSEWGEVFPGAVNLVDLKKQTATDQNYAHVLAKQLQADALYLFDRGYTVADALAAIDAAKAFFLSRFNSFGLKLYRQGPNGFEKINLFDEIQHVTAQQTGLDWAVWVGNKTHKTRARLLLTRLPEEIANRCRQRTKQAAKKRGKTPSQQSLCLCDWGLWIPISFHCHRRNALINKD